jgi:hypothetical protein
LAVACRITPLCAFDMHSGRTPGPTVGSQKRDFAHAAAKIGTLLVFNWRLTHSKVSVNLVYVFLTQEVFMKKFFLMLSILVSGMAFAAGNTPTFSSEKDNGKIEAVKHAKVSVPAHLWANANHKPKESKEDKKARKAAEKAEKEAEKAAKKAEKEAEKEAKKLAKLLKKCEKKPDYKKCPISAS